MKKIYSSALVILGSMIILGGTVSTEAEATLFRIEITNLSPNVLSPTAFISHNAGFDLFDEGATASSAVELLAETGNPTGVIGLAMTGVPSVMDYQVASGGVLAQGNSGQVLLKADTAHSYLTFMSMMGISNDGFIGGTTGDGAISLFSGNMPVAGSYYITPSMVWDAGTEINDEAYGSVGALGGGNGGLDEFATITLNHPGILGIGGIDGIPAFRDWTGGDVALITVSPIPEPATMLLFGSGLAGLAGARLKRRKR